MRRPEWLGGFVPAYCALHCTTETPRQAHAGSLQRLAKLRLPGYFLLQLGVVLLLCLPGTPQEQLGWGQLPACSSGHISRLASPA